MQRFLKRFLLKLFTLVFNFVHALFDNNIVVTIDAQSQHFRLDIIVMKYNVRVQSKLSILFSINNSLAAKRSRTIFRNYMFKL